MKTPGDKIRKQGENRRKKLQGKRRKLGENKRTIEEHRRLVSKRLSHSSALKPSHLPRRIISKLKGREEKMDRLLNNG